MTDTKEKAESLAKQLGTKITYQEGETYNDFIKRFNTRTNKKGNVICSVCAGDFPVHHAMAWIDDCEANYNGINWVKMMQDHKNTHVLNYILSTGEYPLPQPEVKTEEKKEEPKKTSTLTGEELEEYPEDNK
ncbi:hypothetical protein HYU06_05810 [Candidatus Woesearchaeota archaeon]|nr:hypothetical protein [Candidatus Woesearchaeota archaeon]